MFLYYNDYCNYDAANNFCRVNSGAYVKQAFDNDYEIALHNEPIN